ncbi:MAG: hypothetical protein V2A59_03145 [Candidatus Omnitrophota bacterium]
MLEKARVVKHSILRGRESLGVYDRKLTLSEAKGQPKSAYEKVIVEVF